MYPRSLTLPKNHSFFLFGARNTGKTSLLESLFPRADHFWIDLLEPLTEAKYALNPELLRAEVLALPDFMTHVVIDEVQKIPKLLDVVHLLIETTQKKFVLTGSSARKLKQAGVNLLAGRAFVFHLHPLTVFELGPDFDLFHYLRWGGLPSLFSLETDVDKRLFLQAYAQTYLKEEIWGEHLIKRLDPFRYFLEVAAQTNGKILNIANISRDVGVDDKTIKNYFSILEDTLVGYLLPPHHHSFRKRLSHKEKFYFFDVGVNRSLSRFLSSIPQQRTSYYGELFEQFIILECMKLADYYQNEYQFSYLSTKDGAEVDLVIDRPQQPKLFIEIKSTMNVLPEQVRVLNQLATDYQDCEAICLSQDTNAKKFDRVTVLPWKEGLKYIFHSELFI